jgi:hypothetical protein
LNPDVSAYTQAKKQHAEGGDMDYISEDRGTPRQSTMGGGTTSKKKGRPSSKPAWALTEEGFEDAQDDEVRPRRGLFAGFFGREMR